MKVQYLAGLTSLLILNFATVAHAEGTYQRTKDGKTLVWNNSPMPNDAATWSGKRDADGYATGYGTLTWLKKTPAVTTGSNIPTSKYSLIANDTGVMVRGKFDGRGTIVDAQGRIFHGTFADGKQKRDWTPGPLVAKAEGVEPATPAPKPERTESATSTEGARAAAGAEKSPEGNAQAEVTQESAAEIPAEGPAKENAERPTEAAPTKSSSESTQKVSKPLVTQTSTDEPEQSATPREPVAKKAALAPGAVRAIERPTRPVAKKPEIKHAKPAEEATEETPKIAKSAASQPPDMDRQSSEDIPAEGPAEKKVQRPALNAQVPIEESAPPSVKETPADDSIWTLTGPPSSLHVNPPPPEANPPAQIPTPPTTAASPPAAEGPKLTAVNAMDIADIEARTEGYDLGEYQLPKADYNAADGTWSVRYVARSDGKTARKLNVTVQDQTGKAEIRK